ncbi:MAG: DUF5709 domain-containing protein [Jatrophihabitantaceae bacterium]
MKRKQSDIYVGGFEGTSQLDPADSLAGEIGEDPLEAGYSPPDLEPFSARADATSTAELHGESIDNKLAAEEPEVDRSDINGFYERPSVGRIVSSTQNDSSDELSPDASDVFASDAGPAGWAASAEEAAMHIIDEQP